MLRITISQTNGDKSITKAFDNINSNEFLESTADTFVAKYKALLDGYIVKSANQRKYEDKAINVN